MTAPELLSEPRPVWFRLAAWIVAIAVGIAIALFAVDNGSVSAVQHTFISQPVALSDGPPAATLHKIRTFSGAATLIDGVVVAPSTHGASGYDPQSGKQIWTYQRTDIPICARGASDTRAILMYRSGGQCSEAIALDARTGARGWQRTIESEGPNSIAFGNNSFISIGTNKIIAYEEVSGFERFHIYADDPATGQTSTQNCQFLQASAGRIVPVLKRCKTTADSQWVTQLLTYDAVAGDPREVSSSTIGYPKATLVASLSSGSAIFQSANQLLSGGGAQSSPQPISAISVPTGSTPTFISGGNVDVLVLGATAYGFTGTAANVAWSTPVDCLPSVNDRQLNVISGGVFKSLDARSAAPTVTSTFTQPPELTGATVNSSGKFVVVSTPNQTTIYA